ncbi:MAG: CBS domain-containing protein, partial [Desulfurococcales archaeon]|nr:CBS domain-containing protein [Desulfurococcales archaeon]
MAVPRVGDVASRRLPLLGADQTLAKAAEVMLANSSGGVVVADARGRPALVLSYRGLLRALARGASVESRVAEYAVDEPVTVWEGASVVDAFEVMRREGVRFLPVVDSRHRLTGFFEPSHAAPALWEALDYGEAQVEARARGVVVLHGDATVGEAARAMDSNGATELLVRAGGGLALLREEDFLRAVASGDLDARVAEYARGRVIRVPPGFDAKSAVELMVENEVRRLLVTTPERPSTVTLSDLAFEAASLLASRGRVEVGFVLVKAETGRELEVASRLILAEGVTEVHLVTGEYDILAKVEAPSLHAIYDVVRERIRLTPGVTGTLTLAGVRVA